MISGLQHILGTAVVGRPFCRELKFDRNWQFWVGGSSMNTHSNQLMIREAVMFLRWNDCSQRVRHCHASYDAVPFSDRSFGNPRRGLHDNRGAPDVKPALSSSTRITPRQRPRNAESHKRREFPKSPLSCASRRKRLLASYLLYAAKIYGSLLPK